MFHRYQIVNLHDKRGRLNLNFQRGSYLPLAGERRQEQWHGEAVRPGGRPSAERATVNYKALYNKKMNKYWMLFSIETAMFTVSFHSMSNKYSSPDDIIMNPYTQSRSFLHLFVCFKSHQLGLCCSIYNFCLKVNMGRKSKEINQEERRTVGIVVSLFRKSKH